MKSLHYVFNDPGLLQRALTHRSAAPANNERLEFLGDALLGFVIADELCRRLPRLDEGPLTRLRASLVNRETLAEIARELELGPHLKLGEGERKSGGWRRHSILANAVEAIVAAIYLDGGMEASRAEILRWFEQRLETLDPRALKKDPKTTLQEFLQARGKPLPSYRLMLEEGPPHQRHFVVECLVDGHPSFSAEGDSRRRAEQTAAELALTTLREYQRS